jgi:glycogen synthase
MRNIIRHSEMGRIVSDNSPRHLASEISELFRWSEDQAKSVRKRRDTISDFGWATIADRILHEYHGLLGD